MIKALAVFLLCFFVFYFVIEAINRMTKVEKWEFAKTFSYSLALSLAVMVFLVSIVVLF
jgi:hypothetical protein